MEESDFLGVENCGEGVEEFFDVVVVFYVVRALTSVVVETESQEEEEFVFINERKFETVLVEARHLGASSQSLFILVR